MKRTPTPARPRAGRPAVVAEGLRKRFGETEALAGLDLEVADGTVCALLGPNGAGKTTTVRILTTLLAMDGGRAEVAGHDVRTQATAVRASIGVTGQQDALDEPLTGRQNLTLFARLHHLDGAAARRRAAELLEQFALVDAADRPVRQYSGGMKRRLDLAVSVLTQPRVLFLDEPTTGLDPRSRNEVWDAVRALVAGGTTVVLTTHYLEEADQLADQISVVDGGRAIATGTPSELKARIGGDHLDLVLHDAAQLERAAALLAPLAAGAPRVDADRRRVSAPVRDRVGALTEALGALERDGLELEDVAVRRPTLDEVFLSLTGRAQAPAEEVAA